MKIHVIILGILITLVTLGISSAEIYKWVDENGITHYSDSPTHDIPVPVETENDAVEPSKAESAHSRPISEKDGTDTLDPEFFDLLDDSSEESVTAQASIVEIYETDWCGYCKKAKNFFRSRGIEFTTYDIDKDPRAARRMMTMTDQRVVPFVVINGKGIQGYSEQAYLQALRN
jgi:glutaredoxin-like YruB-family protein